MSWLSDLPRHPIFSLPLDSVPTSSSITTTEPSSFEPLTSSTIGVSKLPAIFPNRSPAVTPISTKFSSFRQSHLSSTPRTPQYQQNSNAKTRTRSTPTNPVVDGGRRGLEPENLVDSFKRNQRICLIRGGTELIVAVGRELRWCDLKQVKSISGARGSIEALNNGDSEEDPELGDYKVLTPTSGGGMIDFEIHQLIVNQSAKLLAVVGLHSIRVIELPRKASSALHTAASSIDVRCLEIGKFYHSLPGSPKIAQALWHPLGRHSSSLLVLTEQDAVLREYALHENSAEPSQTLSFLKEDEKSGGAAGGLGTPRKKGFFSAEDESGKEATAMCLGGSDEVGWGSMTIYGLMKNGDIRSICPFLPKRSCLSKRYLHSLNSLVSTKLDQLASCPSSSPRALAVSSPLSSTKALSTRSSLSHSSDHPDSPISQTQSPNASAARSKDQLEKRYSLQLQFLQTLLRQISTKRATQQGDNRGKEQEADENEEVEEAEEGEIEFFDVNAPISRPFLLPQPSGPYLFSPSTTELRSSSSNGTEQSSYASDLAYVSTSTLDGDGEGGNGLGVLMLVYSDGKLEICLEVEKPEPRFRGEEEDSHVSNTNQALALRQQYRGYTLDDAEQAEADDGLPTLLVYETLDLGFTAEAPTPRGKESAPKEEEDGKNWPTLKVDPLYSNDTVWIYSRFGVQCLVLGASKLNELVELASSSSGKAEASEGGEDSQVYWVVKTTPSTTAREGESPESDWEPIVGLEVMNDVYLGYSVLAITGKLQMAAIELSLRVDQELLPSTESSVEAIDSSASAFFHSTPSESAATSKSYTSLLDSPFILPKVFSKRTPPPSTSSLLKGPLKVTPDTLRQFGKQVELYQDQIRELVQGVDQVENRLELQMKEFSRQLSSLRELKKISGDLRESTTGGVGGNSNVGLVGRMRRVEENQVRLLERLDKTLQRLMEQHQGRDQLSQYEKKWFQELQRIERQVKAPATGGSNSSSSLEGKVKRVEAMWQELRPGVEELVRKKQEQQQQGGTPAKSAGGLGTTQIQGLEARLSEEAKLISDAKKKVERLAHSLAQTSI